MYKNQFFANSDSNYAASAQAAAQNATFYGLQATFSADTNGGQQPNGMAIANHADNVAEAAGSAANGFAATSPLRVIHVGQFLMRAGIEHWLQALLRHVNPQRMHVARTVVTSELYDPQMANELGIPVEVGGSASVQAAAAECDVMLASSPANLTKQLGDVRPPLCVFVAHGDNIVSRDLLEVNAPVIDHVIAVSERVKKTVCTGFPTTVIPNGADLAHISRTRCRDMVRDSFGFSEDDFVLGYVGRFSEEKRPEAVIEAAAKLPRQFKVLLVGWGHMRGALLEMANALIPGRFAIVEAQGHLGDYYQAMDALCLLSSSEGFGLVIIESMLCGVPVIATPVGCAPEIISDRINGMVVSEDPASVAEAAWMLQTHPTWAKGLADEARSYAERNGTAAVMGRRYEDLLHQLHAAKRNPIAPPAPVHVISYA